MVEASETCQSSSDLELGASGIITEKRGEGNVGAAANDAKFLTSSRSSAHIPYNVWTWTISSSAKQRRGEERGDLAKKKATAA